MPTNNSFCGGCGSPNFNNRTLCCSCTSQVMDRGFSSLEDFDDWSEPEFLQSESSEFEHEVASTLGESLERVVLQGFQPRAYEAEIPMEDVDWIFLEEEKRWYKQFAIQTDFHGDLGA